jgi:hypothetical protein
MFRPNDAGADDANTVIHNDAGARTRAKNVSPLRALNNYSKNLKVKISKKMNFNKKICVPLYR